MTTRSRGRQIFRGRTRATETAIFESAAIVRLDIFQRGERRNLPEIVHLPPNVRLYESFTNYLPPVPSNSGRRDVISCPPVVSFRSRRLYRSLRLRRGVQHAIGSFCQSIAPIYDSRVAGNCAAIAAAGKGTESPRQNQKERKRGRKERRYDDCLSSHDRRKNAQNPLPSHRIPQTTTTRTDFLTRP